jgi:peroxiredoxin Q/BCP
MLKPGDIAPEFVLPNHRGEDVRLAGLLGRPVLLWFYPKADTPG